MKRVFGMVCTLIFLGIIFSTAHAGKDRDDGNRDPGWGYKKTGLNHSGKTREYWIAAEELTWDHAPSFTAGGPNPMTDDPYTDDQKVFVSDFIGSQYVKSVYRGYTENFAIQKQHPIHLGLLGPVIRAQVGDTIKIHFRNNTSKPASMHPHGVIYTKANEGAPYNDGTSGSDQDDDVVAAYGGAYTYVWKVPERAGPGPNDPSSIVWLYHSHVDEPADTNGGLMGPMVITRKGEARYDGSPRGIDREFFSLFSVIDENASIHFDTNDIGGIPEEDYEESNLMHGINGLVYGDNIGYDMYVGENVRWYILALGTEVDLHTPHWHGVTLIHNGNRIDVAEVFPASAKTYDLIPDNPGTWMFHCHVNDHVVAGMMTKFTIH